LTPFLQWRRAAFEASRAAAPSVAGEPLQGAMAWFQVNCPTCRAALQVWLEAGRTTVQCSAPAPMTCTVLFDVHVDASAMPAAAAKPSRRKIHMQMAPKALTAYNLFMKAEMAAARQSLVGLHGRDLETAAFARAASRWIRAPCRIGGLLSTEYTPTPPLPTYPKPLTHRVHPDLPTYARRPAPIRPGVNSHRPHFLPILDGCLPFWACFGREPAEAKHLLFFRRSCLCVFRGIPGHMYNNMF
jgi:hypothetical protein